MTAGPIGAILVYHRVEDRSRDSFRMGVAPALFRAHMELLARRFRPVRLEEVLRESRTVAVTFDDGYANALEVASPLLLAQKIPATFFVNSGAVGAAGERFWDQLERSLLETCEREFRLELDGERFTWQLDSNACRQRALGEVHARLMRADAVTRDLILSQVRELDDSHRVGRAELRALNETELRALAKRPGHEIGAHGADHLFLPAHAPAAQRAELVDDKRHLEAMLGREVRALAYPFGASDATSERLAREAGFTLAVRGESGPVSDRGDAFALPRVDAAGLSVEELESTLTAHFDC